jgi:hypothetical protein
MTCRCPDPRHAPQPIGTTPNAAGWSPLPEHAPRNDSLPPRNCDCGCNEYSPAGTLLGTPRPFSVDSLPEVPVLPLVLEYEDDDGPSDDHEYVTIKATEFADMLSDLRSCTCQTD